MVVVEADPWFLSLFTTVFVTGGSSCVYVILADHCLVLFFLVVFYVRFFLYSSFHIFSQPCYAYVSTFVFRAWMRDPDCAICYQALAPVQAPARSRGSTNAFGLPHAKTEALELMPLSSASSAGSGGPPDLKRPASNSNVTQTGAGPIKRIPLGRIWGVLVGVQSQVLSRSAPPDALTEEQNYFSLEYVFEDPVSVGPGPVTIRTLDLQRFKYDANIDIVNWVSFFHQLGLCNRRARASALQLQVSNKVSQHACVYVCLLCVDECVLWICVK